MKIWIAALLLISCTSQPTGSFQDDQVGLTPPIPVGGGRRLDTPAFNEECLRLAKLIGFGLAQIEAELISHGSQVGTRAMQLMQVSPHWFEVCKWWDYKPSEPFMEVLSKSNFPEDLVTKWPAAKQAAQTVEPSQAECLLSGERFSKVALDSYNLGQEASRNSEALVYALANLKVACSALP